MGAGYFPYEPSSVGAILAMLLFGGSAIFHTIQMTKTRTWFFTAFLVGAYSEFLVHFPEYNSMITDGLTRGFYQ